MKIREYPDAILREKCIPVERITGHEMKFFEGMLSIMRQFSGIGLAAPQIGVAKSLIVADIGKGALMLANPVILKTKGSDTMEEGCLSVPGVGVVIDRPDEIVVSGLNEKGKVIELEAHGLLARVIQHEVDHLRGKLIIDYMGLLQKMMLSNHGKKKDKREVYADL